MARNHVPSPIARAWLPAAALHALDIDGKVASVARAWSAKWFARKAVRSLDTVRAGKAQTAGGVDWTAFDTDIAIGIAESGKSAMLALMLDCELSAEDRTAVDADVLDETLRLCLDDLRRRLAETFRLDSAKRWMPVATGTPFPIDDSQICAFGIDPQASALRIAIANAALVALAKADLPPPRKSNRLVPIAKALEAQDIAVSAHLGGCALTLADIAGLGLGDVLVLDRSIDTPLDLLVNGQGSGVATCKIVQTDGRLDLTLLESISG